MGLTMEFLAPADPLQVVFFQREEHYPSGPLREQASPLAAECKLDLERILKGRQITKTGFSWADRFLIRDD
jgi:hypothetical protein